MNIFKGYLNGFVSGKCHYIQILINKLMVFFRKVAKSSHPKIFNNKPVFYANVSKLFVLIWQFSVVMQMKSYTSIMKGIKELIIIKKLSKALSHFIHKNGNPLTALLWCFICDFIYLCQSYLVTKTVIQFPCLRLDFMEAYHLFIKP